MSNAPASDELLWRGKLVSYPLITLIAAVEGIVLMAVVFFNPTARPEKQIQGMGWFWFVALLVLALVVVVNTLWLTVEVRRNGFFMRFGPFGWPVQRIRWSTVAKVQRINVRPAVWGGWGYRWVPWMHATAVVMRKGAGLRFDLINDRVFVITLDDSENALHAIDRALHPESEKHCDHDHH